MHGRPEESQVEARVVEEPQPAGTRAEQGFEALFDAFAPGQLRIEHFMDFRAGAHTLPG